MTVNHGVRVHIIDPWTAHLPDFERGEEMPGYVNRQMNDLQQLARELKIAIHIVAHTPKAATQGIGKIRPIRVNDTHGSGDFGKLSDYGICVVSSPYLANLKAGKVRNDNDFNDADIAAANACTPYVDVNSHMIVAIDKVKRRGVMGRPGVYAFAYDAPATTSSSMPAPRCSCARSGACEPMADFRKPALFYASLGWKVLPLAPGRKTTLIPHEPEQAAGMGFSGPGKGVHDATDDIDIIERWADICPDANIGVAMGKPSRSIFGFDIDTRVAGAKDLLNELIRKHGELPRAPLVRTRSGGWHMYLDGSDAPADFKKKLMKRVPCEGGKHKSVATGLEIKWTGGYLVAPPSYIARERSPTELVGPTRGCARPWGRTCRRSRSGSGACSSVSRSRGLQIPSTWATAAARSPEARGLGR